MSFGKKLNVHYFFDGSLLKNFNYHPQLSTYDSWFLEFCTWYMLYLILIRKMNLQKLLYFKLFFPVLFSLKWNRKPPFFLKKGWYWAKSAKVRNTYSIWFSFTKKLCATFFWKCFEELCQNEADLILFYICAIILRSRDQITSDESEIIQLFRKCFYLE